MTIEAAFAALKRLKVVRNHREFSADFLARRPRYLDHLLCSNRQASAAVLVTLILRLQELLREYSASETHAAALASLTDRLWADLQGRCLLSCRADAPACPAVSLGGPG